MCTVVYLGTTFPSLSHVMTRNMHLRMSFPVCATCVCLQLSLKGESTVQYKVLLRGVVME